MFNEDNTIEQMAISTLSKAGWKYVEAENLDRDYTDVKSVFDKLYRNHVS